jgi:hypothetical protein
MLVPSVITLIIVLLNVVATSQYFIFFITYEYVFVINRLFL